MFKSGNKFGTTRKRRAGGRPTREQTKLKQLAIEVARGYIEKHVEKVLKTYLGMAAGRWVTHRQYDAQRGKVITYKDFEVDGPTLRHYVDKVLPMAQPGQLPVQPVEFTNKTPVQPPADDYKGAIEVIRQLVKANVIPAEAFARLAPSGNGDGNGDGGLIQ